MANFQKHGKNVHGLVLQVPGKGVYELGLWGPVDIRNGAELDVVLVPPNAEVGIKRDKMLPGKEPVRVWQFTGLPVGRTVVEAKDRGGATWTTVTLELILKEHKYTHNANEVTTRQTIVTASKVVETILPMWSGLTQQGARTLAAQFIAETGETHCFNWNLGNQKGPEALPHMYLNGVWECLSQTQADAFVKSGHGWVKIADDAYKAAHKGQACTNVLTIFSPPHPASRFRAYATLQDGARDWLDRHKKIASDHEHYLEFLNAGDVGKVAHILKMVRWYTGIEGQYAANMKVAKANIDRQMGPL